MKVGILIVSYNVREALQQCLQAVARLGPGVEAIVVDNASSDASAALIAQHSAHSATAGTPPVRGLYFAQNCGFSRAVNIAAQATQAEYLLLLNPDTQLPRQALDALLHALEADPALWAAGGRQVDAQGHLQLAVGAHPSYTTELLRRFVQRRLDRRSLGVGRALDFLLRKPQQVCWVAASALLVRRTAFERLGGFDERFFLYFEDIDFCLRLRRAGGKIAYVPQASLLHHRGLSAGANAAQAQRAYRDSQRYFWDKHHGRCYGLPLRAYLQAVRARTAPQG
jgi:N-acetylglucosaminyl-diphospho-decaprenol L-rhamnosyltransferase